MLYSRRIIQTQNHINPSKTIVNLHLTKITWQKLRDMPRILDRLTNTNDNDQTKNSHSTLKDHIYIYMCEVIERCNNLKCRIRSEPGKNITKKQWLKSKTVIQEREVYPVASNLCPNISRHKNMQQISFRYKQNLLIRIMYDLIRIRLAALAFTAMVVLISTTRNPWKQKTL